MLQWSKSANEMAIQALIDRGRNMAQLLVLSGAALLVSAIVQSQSGQGLSEYHMLIVLNLSWLNNIAGCILQCLVVLALPDEAHQRRLSDVFPISISRPFNQFLEKQRPERYHNKFEAGWHASLFLAFSIHWFAVFLLHSVAMSALGLWFWSSPSSFSPRAARLPVCRTYYWLFTRIDINNQHLRVFSLFTYSTHIIPCINTFIHAAYLTMTGAIIQTIDERCKSVRVAMSLVALALPPAFLFAMTEQLVTVNKPSIEQGVEQQWTFGQIFSMITSFFVLGEFVLGVWSLRRR